MKFYIHRTRESEIKEKYIKKFNILERYKTIEYSNGSKRTFMLYFIELNTLEELLELSKEFGEIIVNKYSYCDYECDGDIEIYDDHRE